MKNYLGLSALAVAAILGAAASANATLYLKLQESGYPDRQVANGTSSEWAVTTNSQAISYGGYKIGLFSGAVQGGDDLFASSFNVVSNKTGTHTLTITVSATGVTWPDFVTNFSSALGKSTTSTVWSSVIADTYIDITNAAYRTGGPGVTHLAHADSANWPSDPIILSHVPSDHVPYTVTAVFQLTSKGMSGTKGSLVLSAQVNDPPPVPEPGSLALLGTALAGFSVIAPRRRKAA